MCGNFGLLSLGKIVPVDSSVHAKPVAGVTVADDDLDKSLHESMQMVSNLQGVRVQGDHPAWAKSTYKSSTHGYASANEDMQESDDKAVSPLDILQSQTASTEVRGGQAGGYSSLEFDWVKKKSESRMDMMGEQTVAIPHQHRVRCVARKRYPLAADLAGLFLKSRSGKGLDGTGTLSGKSLIDLT